MSGQHRPIAEQVEVPVRLNRSLSAAQRRAAEEARLQLVHASSGWQTWAQQLDGDVWASVPLSMLRERWALQISTRRASALVIARRDRATRQLLIEEVGKPVLQYNYWTVDRPERHAQVSPENGSSPVRRAGIGSLTDRFSRRYWQKACGDGNSPSRWCRSGHGYGRTGGARRDDVST